MTSIMADYFTETFASSNLFQDSIWYMVNKMDLVLNDDMKLSLDRPFSANEVKCAVFDMSLNKSPELEWICLLFV